MKRAKALVVLTMVLAILALGEGPSQRVDAEIPVVEVSESSFVERFEEAKEIKEADEVPGVEEIVDLQFSKSRSPTVAYGWEPGQVWEAVEPELTYETKEFTIIQVMDLPFVEGSWLDTPEDEAWRLSGGYSRDMYWRHLGAWEELITEGSLISFCGSRACAEYIVISTEIVTREQQEDVNIKVSENLGMGALITCWGVEENPPYRKVFWLERLSPDVPVWGGFGGF